MRVIIIGAGQVGSNIARDLASSHDVVVIDVDEDKVENLTYNADVLAMQGDGSSLEILREAGVEDADIVIASTDDDETNIVTCGTVKTISDAFTIARVTNTHFLETWEEAPGALGVDFMVATTLLTAENIVRVVGLPTARDVDVFAEGRVKMVEFEVEEDSPVANQTVEEADRFDSLTFAAILRKSKTDEEEEAKKKVGYGNGDPLEVEIPEGNSVINSGDRVIVIGSPESVEKFGKDIAPEGRKRSKEVFIIGGGDTGYQTAQLLEEKGIKPKVVEQNHERAREMAEGLPGSVVLESNATDIEFLSRENIHESDAVVACLDTDEKNLLVSLLAKRLGAKRSVAVVERGEYVELFEAVGVDVAVNPREVTAEEITRFTRERRAENVAVIENYKAEVVELEIGSDSVLANKTIIEGVKELPDKVVIGAVTRDSELITPRGDTRLLPGDHVIIFAETESIDEVTEKV